MDLRPTLAGWVPVHIGWGANGPVVEWCYFGEQDFTAPFFEQDVEAQLQHPFHLLFRHRTTMEVLGQLHTERPGLAPTGFIFHMSRCGSTVISRMLAAVPRNLVLSEPSPVDFVLHAHLYAPELTEAQRIQGLQWIVSALGQPRHAQQQHLFLKFAHWHILDLPLIERAFPGVPWLFVYRDPVEVMVSNLQRGSWQTMPGPVGAALLKLSPSEAAALPQEEFLARLLGRDCEAALAAAPRGRCINHRELPDAVGEWIPAYFGVAYAAAEREAMRAVGQFHAKNPAVRFAPDSAAKQRAASPLVRQLAEQWVQPWYDQLEAVHNKPMY